MALVTAGKQGHRQQEPVLSSRSMPIRQEIGKSCNHISKPSTYLYSSFDTKFYDICQRNVALKTLNIKKVYIMEGTRLALPAIPSNFFPNLSPIFEMMAP